MLTNVYECFIRKEYSYKKNEYFQYILSTPIIKLTPGEKWPCQLGGLYFTI